MDGWIKVHRKMVEWEWYDCPNTLRVFLHCLLKSNYTEKFWRGQHIRAGEFITSYDKMGQELNLTGKQVRTSLNKLKRTGEVAVKTTNKYSLIQVVNYSNHQDEGSQKGSQRAVKGQSEGSQRATTKKDKKERREEEGEPLPFQKIVLYLNHKAGTNFKPSSEGTKSKIRARFNDGFNAEDFKTVIDNMTEAWLKDPEMVGYLRPETLFGNKFEGYLNRKSAKPKDSDRPHYQQNPFNNNAANKLTTNRHDTQA